MIDLKPCPFCGERLVLKEDHHGQWWAHRSEPGSCFASTSQIFDEEDAAAWNKRAVPKPSSCWNCKGTGQTHDPRGINVCARCYGTGYSLPYGYE